MSKLTKYKFSDLYEMSSGISSSKAQSGHGSPFVSFSTVFNNYFLPEELSDLMNTSIKEQEIYSVKKDDVFITRTSETVDALAMSCVAIKDYPKATFSGFVKRLRPKTTGIVYSKYIAFFLRSKYFRKVLDCNTIMTLRASFNEDIFSFLYVYLPDYEEQVRIGDLLYKIEMKVRTNNKINDNLEQQAKLIYDYWFTQFDFPDENGKPYCSSGGKMVWNEQLKRNIPENWNVVPLLKLVSWESNSQPPKSEFVYEPKEGYVRFIQNRDYDSDTHITYIPRTKNLSIVDRFDILMDKYGDAGAVRYGIEGAFNVALGKICVHNPNYREYIRSFLGSDGIYKFLHNSCMASTRASLSEANLAILNVVVPDEKIILDYENFLHKIRVSILKNKNETVELINLRDWLLPMLMNGQVTIAD
ncbi:restriction endonuclease subunit S [Bulleidia sp. zg-1006]|uniref:restriction endonuclease subunit S n=1 Tax=Bulleidia sp. zg-1006 TaxID=2806552 RepID=UPI00193AD77F|nr:restriction endonuclease subunit S [Bulleidia sp. zg-1006]QRG86428.1 restriction endonuclease subunit S [Bulleidia sp. zg-1006]